MIESYSEEVSRKRKSTRIFWVIVFIFAGFLYFFFQGYYPSIDFSLQNITGTGTPKNERTELMRSFGIINVSVKPKDATIILGSGSYTNDEKRMVNYGTYSLDIQKQGYLSQKTEFQIERETPYYIDLLTLLEKPTYSRFSTGTHSIVKISDTEWIGYSASGMVLLDASFSGDTLISGSSYTHIGEGYFLSGSTILSYEREKDIWEEKMWSGSRNFIRDCSPGVSLKYGYMYCTDNQSILSEKGKIFTGVLFLGDEYIEQSDRLRVGSNLEQVILYNTGTKIESSRIFLEDDGAWYTASGTHLIPLGQKKGTPLPSIRTPFDQIYLARWFDRYIYIFGKKDKDTWMISYEPQRGIFGNMIPFPDIPLEEFRLIKQDGNLFFKTKSALLFLYHTSKNLEWIVDGEILALSPRSALYKKDGIIWKATWKTLDE